MMSKIKIYNDKKEKHHSFEASLTFDTFFPGTGYGATEEEAKEDLLSNLKIVIAGLESAIDELES